MPITVKLDDLLPERRMTLTELAERIDLTLANVFTFPSFTLPAGAEVRVWTKSGVDDGANLFWNRGTAVWNNGGDTAILRDAQGVEQARFSYP